jgi:hypothetical protein
MTTGIATVTETGTGIVIEIAGRATRETIGGMIDVMTEGTIGAMIGVEMIVDVHVPATDETASLHPPEIPPTNRSQPPQSKMKSSRQRGQGWKHGKRREKRRKPWAKPRLKLWHLLERPLLRVRRFHSTAKYCDFIT